MKTFFAAAMQAGHDRVVCEVNIEPPNLASEAFDLAMGFDGIGQGSIRKGRRQYGTLKRLYVKPVPDRTVSEAHAKRDPKRRGVRDVLSFFAESVDANCQRVIGA